LACQLFKLVGADTDSDAHAAGPVNSDACARLVTIVTAVFVGAITRAVVIGIDVAAAAIASSVLVADQPNRLRIGTGVSAAR
jgi:hypothetical protein